MRLSVFAQLWARFGRQFASGRCSKVGLPGSGTRAEEGSQQRSASLLLSGHERVTWLWTVTRSVISRPTESAASAPGRYQTPRSLGATPAPAAVGGVGWLPRRVRPMPAARQHAGRSAQGARLTAVGFVRRSASRLTSKGFHKSGYDPLDLESVDSVVDDRGSWRCRPGSRSMTSSGPRSSR